MWKRIIGSSRYERTSREDVLGVLAVAELEQLVDSVAAASLPVGGRLEHGHQHLLTADRGHLLADDRLDPRDHPMAGGQVGPQPRPELADQPGADHQPVREGLGIGRVLAQGRQEELGEAGHRAAQPIGGPIPDGCLRR
jgi:hypothetical protein